MCADLGILISKAVMVVLVTGRFDLSFDDDTIGCNIGRRYVATVACNILLQLKRYEKYTKSVKIFTVTGKERLPRFYRTQHILLID